MSEPQVREGINSVAASRRIEVSNFALNPVFVAINANRFVELQPSERLNIYRLNFDILQFSIWPRQRSFFPFDQPRILNNPEITIRTIQKFYEIFVRSDSQLLSNQARGTFNDNCPWG